MPTFKPAYEPMTLEKHGRSVLNTKAPASKKTAKWIVRIYYTSQGGELLGVDSEPLTLDEKEALVNYVHNRTTEVNYLVFSKYDRNVYEIQNPAECKRIVKMPSQISFDQTSVG